MRTLCRAAARSAAMVVLQGFGLAESALSQEQDQEQEDASDCWIDLAGAAWREVPASPDEALPEEPPAPGEPVPPGTLHAEPEEWHWAPGALLALNAIDYDKNNSRSNDLSTAAASVILRGIGPDGWKVWLEVDLDGEHTRHHISEAWVERAFGDHQWVRAGQIRVAPGTEFATRYEDLPVVGYAFPAWLDGRWDVGVAWDGYTAWSWYQLVATTGSGFNLDGDKRRDPDLMGRIMLLPEHDPEKGFDGLFGGGAYSWNPEYHDNVQLDTPLEQTVVTTPDLDATGASWLHLEAGARYGSFRAGLENVIGKVENAQLPGGGEHTFDELKSWSGFASWNFTGPAPRWYRGGWLGYGPDDFDRGQALPVELAFRYCNGDIDRDLFDLGLTDYDPSTQEVRTVSAALSTYLCPLSRVALQLNLIIADHELTTLGGTARDTSWSLSYDQRF